MAQLSATQATPRFKTLKGRLTPYALACGYVERFEDYPRIVKTLLMEHGSLRVDVYYPESGVKVSKGFERIGEARLFYDGIECVKTTVNQLIT